MRSYSTCPGPAAGLPRTGMWVLDFMKERFYNTSPSDFESMFIRAGDSETKEGLKIEEARAQQQE